MNTAKPGVKNDFNMYDLIFRLTMTLKIYIQHVNPFLYAIQCVTFRQKTNYIYMYGILKSLFIYTFGFVVNE